MQPFFKKIFFYVLFVVAAKANAQQQIENFKDRFHNYPVNQMFGLQSGMPAFMINMHRIDDISDANAYISRLNEFNKYFTQLIKNLTITNKDSIIIGLSGGISIIHLPISTVHFSRLGFVRRW